MWLLPLQAVAHCLGSCLPRPFIQQTHMELQLVSGTAAVSRNPTYLLPPGVARRGKDGAVRYLQQPKKEPSRSILCQEESSKGDGTYQMASGPGSAAGRNRSQVRGGGPGRGALPGTCGGRQRAARERARPGRTPQVSVAEVGPPPFQGPVSLGPCVCLCVCLAPRWGGQSACTGWPRS